MQINRKIPLVTVSVLFVVMLFGSTISILNFRDNYREALLTGTMGAGFSLNSIVTELLALGLPLQSLDGLDSRVAKMLEEYPHLAYVGIGDLGGTVLFHSDRKLVGRTSTSPELSRCLAAVEPFVQDYKRFDGAAYHDVCIPVMDADQQRVGVIRLGFSMEIIQDKVVAAALQSAVIFVVTFLIIAVLINSLLSRLVTRRIALLADKAGDIADGRFAEVHASDEIADELDSLDDSLGKMSHEIQEQIGALQEAQEQLEIQVRERTGELLRVQHIAKLGHWRLDIVSGELFWSDEIYRIFEIEQTDFPPSFEAFLSVIHPEDRTRVQQAYQEHLETRTPYEIQHRLIIPDGSIKYVREQCETEYDPQGKPLRSLGTVQDITEHVRMQELIMQSEKMLSVGGLAAGMAHELNNPLGGILQGIQNIQRRLSSDISKNQEVAHQLDLELEKVDEYFKQRGISNFLQGIKEAGERAGDIVNNMLQFSRKTTLTFTPEDIPSLLDRTLELAMVDYDLKKTYDFKNIEIVREYDASIEAVPCIASEIQQVLLNLLRNAAQAFQLAGTGDGTTHRIILRTYSKRDRVCVEVKDNGPGMDETVRLRVFEPFFTTRKVGEGMGLGLSVSYFIVTEEHGGQMSVESQPGQGATFTFCLPVERASIGDDT